MCKKKESNISVRYKWTNLSLGSLFGITRPRDAKIMTLGIDLSIRTSHSCQILIFNISGSISKEQYCHLKGSKTQDGYLHTCSTCAVITTLPDNYFPRFINEAVCKTGDSGCFVINGLGKINMVTFDAFLILLCSCCIKKCFKIFHKIYL